MRNIIAEHYRHASDVRKLRILAPESQVCKGTEEYGDHAGPSFDHKGYGRTAMRTEMIGRPVAAVCNALPRLCFAADGNLFLRPARLGSKGATGAPLAIQAMTDRHANRLSFASSLKLSAAACRDSALHGHTRNPLSERSSPSTITHTNGPSMSEPEHSGDREVPICCLDGSGRPPPCPGSMCPEVEPCSFGQTY